MQSLDDMTTLLERVVAPGYGGRLLDKGLARGLIWRDGTLPQGSPSFPEALTEDLLDYAHGVVALALRVKAWDPQASVLERAFLVAGESIESVVLRGQSSPDCGFHRLTAAVAFHLGGYSARAYTMLPSQAERQNLAPSERVLLHLLRRNLAEMHAEYSAWLLDGRHSDGNVEGRLRSDDAFDVSDAVDSVLTSSLMKSLALLDHGLAVGDADSAAEAAARLHSVEAAALELGAVSHWWTSALSFAMAEQLWETSLHQQLPELAEEDDDYDRWSSLRTDYIRRLRASDRASIELWPSQIQVVDRVLDARDDLVVALPTGAGKTRIAEMCILRALAGRERVVYVTPLRALSAQVERDLSSTFVPLGFTVSSLYGSAGIEMEDSEVLGEADIVVSTPEKLDFALRNDDSVIDDVGLVVLDEGHMLGPQEREVRYEALVQRLLSRTDAAERRLVCLSALFPSPEDMEDLVAWLRQDQPGDPVHSVWRPTRQRFGVLRWGGSAARLEINLHEESPFVPRFVESQKPPAESRRRNSFPHDKQELTLAAAWTFAQQNQDVLVYCSTRKSVEALGRTVSRCIRHKVLSPLVEPTARIQNAILAGTEWLGADHPAVECLKYGVALHHAGLPRPFLGEIEGLLRSRECPIVIASPTLAQGLNLSASVLLVPSIWRNREVVPTTEFANVAGRAGRAYVDMEGLVIHVVWEDEPRRALKAVRRWESLVASAKAPKVVSGILLLTWRIYQRIAEAAAVPLKEVVEYVAGNGSAWAITPTKAEEHGLSVAEWERDIASLDSAVLALLDADTAVENLDDALASVLQGSLFARQLSQETQQAQLLVGGFIAARAAHVWTHTTEQQRRGYHAAGVGLRAGSFLDEHLDALVSLLIEAEAAIAARDVSAAAEPIVKFAELVLETAPFRAPRPLPDGWQEALRSWVNGEPASEIVRLCDYGVDLLQEALSYRLPWAMEAVRVHAVAMGVAQAEELAGTAPLPVETGTANRSSMLLLSSGLESREAAFAAIDSTAATFGNRLEMMQWLDSDIVKLAEINESWPTSGCRHQWIAFRERARASGLGRWRRSAQSINVDWESARPSPGQSVIVEPSAASGTWLILTPAYDRLGVTTAHIAHEHRDIVSARVSKDGEAVEVEYFGPLRR